ncbi:MAG: PD40 domain-containing protein [Candidatus Eisenbacteria bacterium]|nr:PD40 domain-containing protein [Candidatus Eisenbacteria bacterium]
MPLHRPDGSYLILESRRPGGYGSSDLYVSFHQAGAWTTPRNLGPSINSTYIEDGPFVSSDGKSSSSTVAARPSPPSSPRSGGSTPAPVPPRAVGHRRAARAAEFIPALTLRPNPSRGATTLFYTLPEAGPVSLRSL